ncbi:hypothetical protein CPAR01_09569 [Colletotrichum paranaense]|uniref:Uncharacterized protein n=1 Tax=Colletotrichum paranaense TaxID=1914294 RepID=A0ABQ9SH30_9PEZI|nr:uncharacterized protein CPAR01_09569 [Colletotrichum paranaense]KAK1536027.1 hypothetical protein CPAR01_09569 [Colletotrichum paranaense]
MKILVGVYGVLICLAVLAGFAGALAVRRNRGFKGTRLSHGVDAARGPGLDGIVRGGRGVRGGEVASGFKTPRLGHGLLKSLSDDEIGCRSVMVPAADPLLCRFGFGFEGEVE